MEHWTWVPEPNNYEFELIESDYLPSISLALNVLTFT